MNYNEAKLKLEAAGQEQLLNFYEELDEKEQETLLRQIDETDFSVVSQIGEQGGGKRGSFAPLAAMQRDEIVSREKEFRELGIKALQEGKAAALLLAGGMGTRLGSDNPKGMYDIGETKHVYIFQRIIENLLEVVKEAGTVPRLFIMTSESNHEATVSFLKEHKYFGYEEEKILFFRQAMAPACDKNGKVFLESKGRIAVSPNGNAGWFTSLLRAGYGELIDKEGIEWINIFAVDNVLQRILDPVFLGATIQAKVSTGSKVVRKNAPDEKVGVMCLEDGRPSIVEYYELSKEMMEARDEKGESAYNYGVILNYLFHLPELKKIAGNALPYHVVEKKIKHIDGSGTLIEPETPNGFKFEQLVLDMIHELDSCLPFEVIREKEFAPIKNLKGVDSVDTAKELLKLNGIEL
ncbi:MAG: UTP--glucose-1-phosphate uridylyltransferase [Lachnospiraceae bacterium]|nr:UTP--glucose-1-phosphate uridylyltransferase [Lachnospiraceae bacterium]